MVNLKLIIILTIICQISSICLASQISIHELLKSKGLPQGLLPKVVKSYEYDEESGVLNVFLNAPCYTKYDNRVKFETVIRANLSFGELIGVQGLTQEELFIWFPVKMISVDDPNSGLILFDIGMAHKQLSLSLFEDPPTCKITAHNNYQENIVNYNGRKDKGFEAQR